MLILLIFAEVAERLGIQPNECFELIHAGQLRPMPVEGHSYFNERAVEDLRRSRETPDSADH